MASTNIFSLAEELGFWKPGTPFLWHEVYGGPGDPSHSLREWRALSLVAPSLGLKVTIPWEMRPKGCADVVWRYSGNPFIPRNIVPPLQSQRSALSAQA